MPKSAAVIKEQVDQVAAVQRKMIIPTITFEFRGVEFQIPKLMDDWNTEACLALGAKNYMLSAKLLLGVGQWAILQQLGSKRRDMIEFLEVLGPLIDSECIA